MNSDGRLGLDDEQVFGTNVIPLNMSREELRDGYIGLMHDLYAAEFYFDRPGESLPHTAIRSRKGSQ